MKELYNTEAEQIILGNIVLNNDLIYKIDEIIKTKHFYEPVHQEIYDYFKLQIIENKISLSSVLCKEFFNSNNLTKSLGGTNYLSTILSVATGVYDTKHYAEKLVDLSVRREAREIAEELQAFVVNGENDVFKSLEEIKNKIEGLEDNSIFKYNLKHIGEVVDNVIPTITSAMQGTVNNRLKTGLKAFDSNFGGLANNELIIFAGRPSMGKSAIASQIGLNIAKQNKNVIFFSEEMSNDSNAYRTLANMSSIKSDNYQEGKINDFELNKIDEYRNDLKNTNFYIDDTTRITPSYMKKTLRKFYSKNKTIDLIIVDYLQFTGSDIKSHDPKIILQDITKKLKSFAKTYNCPVLCLSQLSRAVESRTNRRPNLADLRDSGTIEQDADMVIFCYRAEYYAQKDLEGEKPGTIAYQDAMNILKTQDGVCELLVRKNRHGACGTAYIKFIAEFFRAR
jgi:replicative DNA helicase